MSIRLRGRVRRVRPELVSDPDQIEQLLAVMAAANPGLKRFVRIPRRPDGHLDPPSLENAIAHGFRVVRWHPDPRGFTDGMEP